MKILGISAFYHDSAAALIENGRILAAVQEERFTRKKHDAAFPANAIRYCLEESGYVLSQLDAVVFYDKPFLKFERLLETYYNFAPRGIHSFITSIPVWVKEKMFLKSLIHRELKKIGDFDHRNQALLFPEHHLSHAASTFFCSPFKDALILTIDGVGEWSTASLCRGRENNIEVLKELHFPHSVGLLYSAFTYFLGFRVNSGEYKLMGLAPYGIPGSERVERFESTIRNNLVDIKEDGSLWMNPEFFTYATGLRMVPDKKWKDLFGFPRRKPESQTEQHHCDLALAIQNITEEVMIKMIRHGFQETGLDQGERKLCLAGGVALNCVANGKLLKQNITNHIYIQPAAGDAGGALGAALAAHHIYFENPRTEAVDLMQGALYGPSYSPDQIKRVARKYNAGYTFMKDPDEKNRQVSVYLDQGLVVGWFQGRMEFGPRALGNRSILGDARNRDMQKKLNLKIKFRESFRPFAPIILAEHRKEFFEMGIESPYMLLIDWVSDKRRRKLPADYYRRDLMDRLYTERSDIPAVTHLDFSARLQTVHRDINPDLHSLLSSFYKLTACPILVNTSFNVRGEPIVCSPEDAYICFMRTEMDVLVMGDYIFLKGQQPEWKEEGWREKLKPD